MPAPRVRKRLVVLALVAALPIPFALAEDGGAPPPTPVASSATPAAVTSAAPPSGSGSSMTAPIPASSVPRVIEGEEADEHPQKPVAPQNIVIVRQTVIVKDGMARIPGGKFTMGTDDKKAPPNERPSRNVSVSPFWLDKTEVTVAAYKACVDKGACPKPAHSSTSCTWDQGEPQLPISCVSWNSASAFCGSVGKRLPREVEW